MNHLSCRPRAALLLAAAIVTPVGLAHADTGSLDRAWAFLRANPPTAGNLGERRTQMATIQAAADQFSPQSWEDYCKAWSDDRAVADRMEAAGVLYYLRRATDHAIQEIRTTRVQHGLAAWHIYNMGYVFKTPEACFGVDLHLRDAARLAGDLDFLLVSHQHSDHRSDELIAAMIKAQKPVVTLFNREGTFVDAAGAATRPSAEEFQFGSIRVRVDIGDHHFSRADQLNNMLMYQVDCGPAANNATIYHSGDGSNAEKMRPDRPVTIFIPHVCRSASRSSRPSKS